MFNESTLKLIMVSWLYMSTDPENQETRIRASKLIHRFFNLDDTTDSMIDLAVRSISIETITVQMKHALLELSNNNESLAVDLTAVETFIDAKRKNPYSIDFVKAGFYQPVAQALIRQFSLKDADHKQTVDVNGWAFTIME
jgi:hypothetical protein